MERVVIVGAGASGKSTLATQLGEITGLPVVRLDQMFWQPGLSAPPRDQWVWLLPYRYKSRPFMSEAIRDHATPATLCMLSNPKAVTRFLADIAADCSARTCS